VASQACILDCGYIGRMTPAQIEQFRAAILRLKEELLQREMAASESAEPVETEQTRAA
jgi:hypothetical protein